MSNGNGKKKAKTSLSGGIGAMAGAAASNSKYPFGEGKSLPHQKKKAREITPGRLVESKKQLHQKVTPGKKIARDIPVDKHELDRQARIQINIQKNNEYHSKRKKQENIDQGYFIDEHTGKKEYPNQIREYAKKLRDSPGTWSAKDEYSSGSQKSQQFLKKYEKAYKDKSPEDRATSMKKWTQ